MMTGGAGRFGRGAGGEDGIGFAGVLYCVCVADEGLLLLCAAASQEVGEKWGGRKGEKGEGAY